jgi:hypothetical protein
MSACGRLGWSILAAQGGGEQEMRERHSSVSSSRRASQLASASTVDSASGCSSTKSRRRSASQPSATCSAPRRSCSSSIPRSVKYKSPQPFPANTASRIAACSAACTFDFPEAGAELAGRETTEMRRFSSFGKCSAMYGQLPMFAGSSCTHTTSAEAGNLANSAAIYCVGRGYSRSTRRSATSVAPLWRRRSARS